MCTAEYSQPKPLKTPHGAKVPYYTWIPFTLQDKPLELEENGIILAKRGSQTLTSAKVVALGMSSAIDAKTFAEAVQS